MRKIIFLLILAAVFIGCKTESSPDPVKGPWKVTIDTKTAPGLSNYNLTVEDGKPLSSQLTQTPTNPFDFIVKNPTYQSGEAYITGYRDLDGQLYDLASTPVTKDITIRVEWGFKNITDDVCKGKNADNPPYAYVPLSGDDDFAGVYCNTKDWGNLDKNYLGKSFLLSSAYYGKLDIVKYLVLRGSDINQIMATKDTALILSLAYNFTDVAKYLVESGANVNLHGYLGNTALIVAVNSGESLEIVQEIVNIGKADLSLRNDAGNTAMAVATTVKNGTRPGTYSTDIYNFLLSKNAPL